MKYILQHKLLLAIILLSIWTVVSISIISSNKKAIKSKNYEISELCKSSAKSRHYIV